MVSNAARVSTDTCVDLADALVTNFSMKPAERFVPLAHQTRLLDSLAGTPERRGRGRIGVDFGSVGLCHVAAGFTDAMIEFAKGFAVWDLMPGHYILTATGGVVTDLDASELAFDHTLDTVDGIQTALGRRQRFIAARNRHLAEELGAALVAS